MFVFFYIILFIAFIYVLLIRIIRPRLVDMERMKKLQERTKEISKQMKEAGKAKDIAKMEQLNKIYMNEIMPEINAVMMQQIKFTFVLIILFSVAIFFVAYFDPSTQDDIHLNLTNVDSQWIGSFRVDAPGVWRITAKTDGIFGGNENQTYIFVESKDPPPHLTQKGEPMPLLVDNKKVYKVGEVVTVSVLFHKQPEVVVDRGTRFSAPLPFEIFSIKEVEGASSWFIIDLIVINIVFAIWEKIKR